MATFTLSLLLASVCPALGIIGFDGREYVAVTRPPPPDHHQWRMLNARRIPDGLHGAPPEVPRSLLRQHPARHLRVKGTAGADDDLEAAPLETPRQLCQERGWKEREQFHECQEVVRTQLCNFAVNATDEEAALLFDVPWCKRWVAAWNATNATQLEVWNITANTTWPRSAGDVQATDVDGDSKADPIGLHFRSGQASAADGDETLDDAATGSPSPAPAPSAAPSGAPGPSGAPDGLLAKKPWWPPFGELSAPEHGFHGPMVRHRDGVTVTADWRKEYVHNPMDPDLYAVACQSNPTRWCYQRGFTTTRAPLQARASRWGATTPLGGAVAVAAAAVAIALGL